VITVTIEGQPWDDPAAPWTPTTHTYDRLGYWNAMDALHMLGAAEHYENTRPVAWTADTDEERAEMRRLLGRHPDLLALEDTAALCDVTVQPAGEDPQPCGLELPCPKHGRAAALAARRLAIAHRDEIERLSAARRERMED